MAEHVFEIPTSYFRRLPDPFFKGAERYIALVAAADVPPGIPLDPNPRDQNINRRVYQDVLESLRSPEDRSFHLKNKGITMIAESVKAPGGRGPLRVKLREQHGILDGGHTYRIVLEGQQDDPPPNQFVKFEILIGVDTDLITDIAGGLNTAVQVQEMSLANLSDRFDWIKESLSKKPYSSSIAYRENEGDCPYDVRDIIAFLDLFNVALHPNEGADYPITAYRAKSTTLKQYLGSQESFMKLETILPDILELAETISSEARARHNEKGGKAGLLTFVEQRKKGLYDFPFIEKKGSHRLTNGALFPMLGAFRWMVEEADDGVFRWKGSFEEVKDLWRRCAGDLMRTTQETSAELGRNPNAIGKSKNHWARMHGIVLKDQLLRAAKEHSG